MKSTYDIFISYRRNGGAQYARIIELQLKQRGYRVFLDYDEIRHGPFGERIKTAIKQAKIFMLVLSPGCLDRCVNEEDWVRQEILLAIELNKHFIPINPDGLFEEVPAGIPDAIRELVNTHQRSDINFGQALSVTIDLMEKNRIKPYVTKHSRIRMLLVALLAVLLAGAGAFAWHQRQLAAKRDALLTTKTLDGSWRLNWSPAITLPQLQAVHELLAAMVKVEGGEFLMGAAPHADGGYAAEVDTFFETPQLPQSVKKFWIGKYEVTNSEWARIMQTDLDETKADLPVTHVSLHDCRLFATRLCDLTGLPFRLPTEAEWEYAARGRQAADNTLFAGRDRVDEVGWYAANSGGRVHPRNDSSGGFYCNSLDLFDMSGNVAEWCDTPFRLYKDLLAQNPHPEVIDPEGWVVRGGHFDAQPYELTVTHRDVVNAAEKLPNVGLRLVIGVSNSKTVQTH